MSRLLGPGRDKTEFLIFDYCQNFEFFDLHPDGTGGKVGKPLLQRIFQSKLSFQWPFQASKMPMRTRPPVTNTSMNCTLWWWGSMKIASWSERS